MPLSNGAFFEIFFCCFHVLYPLLCCARALSAHIHMWGYQGQIFTAFPLPTDKVFMGLQSLGAECCCHLPSSFSMPYPSTELSSREKQGWAAVVVVHSSYVEVWAHQHVSTGSSWSHIFHAALEPKNRALLLLLGPSFPCCWIQGWCSSTLVAEFRSKRDEGRSGGSIHLNWCVSDELFTSVLWVASCPQDLCLSINYCQIFFRRSNGLIPKTSVSSPPTLWWYKYNINFSNSS